ncbi:hypothetical protein ABIE66_004192 [Peribacillus sp. B2I2]
MEETLNLEVNSAKTGLFLDSNIAIMQVFFYCGWVGHATS